MGGEEVETLLGFHEFLIRGGVDGAEVFDFGLRFLIRLFGRLDDGGIGVFGDFEFGDRNVQFLAAGLIQELEFGLPPGQFDFDFGPVVMARFNADAEFAQHLIGGGERFAILRFLLRHFKDGAVGGDDLFGEFGQLLVERDVLVEDARAVFAPALHFRSDLLPAVAHLAEEIFEARKGGAFTPAALFKTGEFGAKHGMLLAHSLRFGLSEFQLFAQGFKGLFAIAALGILLFHQLLVAGAVLVSALLFPLQAFEFLARDGDAGVGAIRFFGGAAAFVIERDGVFLAGLLQLAEPFEVGFERGGLVLQGFLFTGLEGKQAFLLFKLGFEVAEFALEDERPGGLFAAAGEHTAVIAGAIGQQEVAAGVRFGHAAGFVTVGGEIAAGEARQIAGLSGETVREGQEVGEPRQVDHGSGGFRRGGGGDFHVERGAAFQFRAEQVHALFGLVPFLYHHVFQLFGEELFDGALPFGIDFDEIGEDTFGTELAGAAVLHRGEQLLGRFGGVAVMREDVFERFAFGAEAGAVGAQLVDAQADFLGFPALVGEAFFGLFPIRNDGLDFLLALGDLLRELTFEFAEAGDLGRGNFLVLLHAGAFALDAGEVRFGLGELILDGGGFAEQAQNHGAGSLDGALGFANAQLDLVAHAVLFHQAGANFLHLLVKIGGAFGEGGALGLVLRDAVFEVSRLLVGAGHALFNTGGFAHLGFEAAFGALGIHRHGGELAARFGELGFERVEDFLRLLAVGVFVGGLDGGVFQFGGRLFELRGGFFRFHFERDKTAREHGAELAFEFALQFLIALRFGGLALQGVHLAGDFLEDVEDSRKVLFGAFELGFGEAAAALVFRDTGGFFEHGAAVLRFGGENLPDAALFDDGVAFRTEAGAHEDVLNVPEARLAAVDQVFGFAGAEEAARDGDLAGFGAGVMDHAVSGGVVDLVDFERGGIGGAFRGRLCCRGLGWLSFGGLGLA